VSKRPPQAPTTDASYAWSKDFKSSSLIRQGSAANCLFMANARTTCRGSTTQTIKTNLTRTRRAEGTSVCATLRLKLRFSITVAKA
jgi:hypothetical protein